MENKRFPFRTTIFFWQEAGGLALMALSGLSVGLALNLCREHPLPWVYESKASRLEKAAGRIMSEPDLNEPWTVTDRPSSNLTAEQLREFLAAKRGLVFDARPTSFYRIGHLPGALSLPRSEFERTYKVYQAQLETNRNQPIVLYCSNASCEDSKLLKEALNHLGFRNVALFVGGWEEWQDKGLPTETEE